VRLTSRVLVVAAATLAWAEWVTWRGSREAIPDDRLDPRAIGPDEIVLVLGCPANKRGTVSVLQRWRTRIAVRSTDVHDARLVFTGGATRGGLSEARLMADYAVQVLGVPERCIVLEERAMTTWDNVAFALPVLKTAGTIKVASNTFHARRARKYLALQAPSLAPRLHRARDYVPGEHTWAKPLLVAFEAYRAGKARRSR